MHNHNTCSLQNLAGVYFLHEPVDPAFKQARPLLCGAKQRLHVCIAGTFNPIGDWILNYQKAVLTKES